ncbi:MAG TPA: enolase C-terminal domain-like protein, partial [Acidimicrobiales bacterium]|nr:enolase C-terminal domain-like protein [Acidimicrobiales bacterium]
MSPRLDAVVESVHARVFTVPTDRPESDGTLEWDSTTIVVVEARGGGRTGLGYTYGSGAVADVVNGKLADTVKGRDALAVGHAWSAMVDSVRNVGRPGVASMAISAVDTALWDLKARIIEVPLVVALDAHHDRTPIYGSGGFCSYALAELADQLTGWADAGIPRVKMKVGRHPDEDPGRLAVARDAVGPAVELYVDANGAYTRKQALWWADAFADAGVRWFEEPVSSDDLAGLRLLRDRGPGGMDVAAGEYGYEPAYFERMLTAGAVDCLQADVTRCGGITGLLKVAGLCDAHTIDLSAHCAPQLSAHACTAVWHLRHLEYFHDHVRIESMLFDGVLEPEGGALVPDRSRAGLGLELKQANAARF